MMVILDRLHRGDIPRMRAVTAEQTKDRLVFADHAGADAFIEAYRRADPASSFTKFEVPEMELPEFWQACRDADWHYDASDDPRVWREGGSAMSRLSVQATQSMAHRRMFIDWRRHRSSGPAYGNEQHPAPEQPASTETI